MFLISEFDNFGVDKKAQMFTFAMPNNAI
jgi:hypothetical protein